ncbi:interferon-induced 35 kDa protein [Aulostomus maculatus]
MSDTDEDFSLVDQPPSQEHLEGILASIVDCKRKHKQSLEEQRQLTETRDQHRQQAQQFRSRLDQLALDLSKDRQSYSKQLEQEKEKVLKLNLQLNVLQTELEQVQAALKEEEDQQMYLEQQTDVSAVVPERPVVFKGQTEIGGNKGAFEMDSHIVYPMEGGTALVMFEEEGVARKVVSNKIQQVGLEGDCWISVEARPVQLILPRLVEIESVVCPQRVLISGLPNMDETLQALLELHFSKRKNGGGEVEECEYLPDAGTMVLKFLDKNVAQGLIKKEHLNVVLQQNKYRLRATPFLSGSVTKLKTKVVVCPRTVLLTGIPSIMEQETMQDLLEIHFQKSINGGEIEELVYNPLGQQTSALFKGVNPE